MILRSSCNFWNDLLSVFVSFYPSSVISFLKLSQNVRIDETFHRTLSTLLEPKKNKEDLARVRTRPWNTKDVSNAAIKYLRLLVLN